MQPNLSITDLKAFKIPVPDLDSRKAIVSQIQIITANTNALYRQYQSNLTDLDDLRQSLLKKAFAGELT